MCVLFSRAMSYNFATFDIPIAVSMNITIFLDVTVCSLIGRQ
jgi:hypothetical protein